MSSLTPVQLELRRTATGTDGHSSASQREAEDDVALASRILDDEVPDGGAGWIVVSACSVITFWFVGTTYSYGIIQAALVKQGLSTPATLSFVGSLTVACIAAFALVNARVIRALGARRTGLLGVGLLGLGEILSSFTTRNIAGLFVCAGAVMGVGTSLCFMVVSTTPAQYFSKRRGIANGVVYAGGGLGGTVISFAMDGLIQRLGVPWTYRIIGLLTLATGLPAAWLVQERVPIRTSSFIEWRLFRDFRFAILFVAGALATFPLFVPPFFLPLYSNSLGLSPSAGAGLVAGFNFSSAVGRLGFGFMSDWIGPLNSLFISLALSGSSMLVLWPVSTSLGPLITFVIINGAANGGFFSVMPTVVGSVFGSARMGVAMGMVVSGWVFGYMLGSPIAGYLLAAYGGEDIGLRAYHPAIFYAGSMATGAAGLVALLRLKIKAVVCAKL